MVYLGVTMTLGEARDQLRDRKLVESSTDFYGNGTLLLMVTEASREVAAAFRFPKRTLSATINPGNVSITAPAGILDVEGVSYNGIGVSRRSFKHIKFFQSLPADHFFRGYHFDPGTKQVTTPKILLGPPAAVSGVLDVEYVDDPYPVASPTAGTKIWDGLYPQFHELVVLRATVKSFEMGYEMEQAQYYLGRYAQILGEFTAFHGMTNVPEVSDDAG